MANAEPQFLEIGEGRKRRRIAYIAEPPAKPGGVGLLWLIGLKSDMGSTKALALAEWTKEKGLGFTRFDYSGHGRSGGTFENATVTDWLEEALAIFRNCTRGPQIVVGSSTGAHVALLLLKTLLELDTTHARRIRGLVLIAPAWDVTELIWNEVPAEARREIMEKGVWHRPSPYDPNGYPITREFIEDGRRRLIAKEPFDPGRPIDVLQGLEDRDVPAAYAHRLANILRGDWVRFTDIPDGEHRLSRPQDLALLYQLIERHLSS